jgi:hypothetical protein
MLIVNEYASIRRLSPSDQQGFVGGCCRNAETFDPIQGRKGPSLDKERILVARMTSAVWYEAGQRDDSVRRDAAPETDGGRGR